MWKITFIRFNKVLNIWSPRSARWSSLLCMFWTVIATDKNIIVINIDTFLILLCRFFFFFFVNWIWVPRSTIRLYEESVYPKFSSIPNADWLSEDGRQERFRVTVQYCIKYTYIIYTNIIEDFLYYILINFTTHTRTINV